MDNDLLKQGYKTEPTRYNPHIGYARLQALISGKPSKRVFDCKRIHLPTFYNRFFHNTQISRHEQQPQETFRVTVGPFTLDSYQDYVLHGFTFGGVMQVSIQENDLYCDFTYTAPIILLQADTQTVSSLLTDEIVTILAEKKAGLGGYEDEMYARLDQCDPHMVFLGCLSSLYKKLSGVPASLRKGKFPKTFAQLEKAIQIVRQTDGWDGRSPTLDDLLASKV